MCSQNDDPSQHASDDTLRAARRDLLDIMRRMDCQDLFDDAFYALVRYVEAERRYAALAASATDEQRHDHIAWARHVRSEHEATHGEAEQCGEECVVLGLTEFEDEGPPEGTRLVLFTEELALALGADRVEWGEPDEHGWYTPTLSAASATDEPKDTLRAALDSASRDLHDAVTRAYDELRAALAASATDEGVAAQVRLTHHPVTNPMYFDGRPICDHDSQEWPCVTELQVRKGLRARLAASATEERKHPPSKAQRESWMNAGQFASATDEGHTFGDLTDAEVADVVMTERLDWEAEQESARPAVPEALDVDAFRRSLTGTVDKTTRDRLLPYLDRIAVRYAALSRGAEPMTDEPWTDPKG